MKKLEFHPSYPSAFIISLKAEGCEGWNSNFLKTKNHRLSKIDGQLFKKDGQQLDAHPTQSSFIQNKNNQQEF